MSETVFCKYCEKVGPKYRNRNMCIPCRQELERKRQAKRRIAEDKARELWSIPVALKYQSINLRVGA